VKEELSMKKAKNLATHERDNHHVRRIIAPGKPG